MEGRIIVKVLPLSGIKFKQAKKNCVTDRKIHSKKKDKTGL